MWMPGKPPPMGKGRVSGNGVPSSPESTTPGSVTDDPRGPCGLLGREVYHYSSDRCSQREERDG